jgi:hypothetical protein
MPTAYKVLGQVSPTITAVTITTKALTNNVATLTTSAAHSLIVGQQVSVTLTTPDASFDGLRTITAVTSTTFSFSSVNSNVTSVAATGSANGIQWTTLYSCPSAAGSAMVSSSLIVTNRSTQAGYYFIAIDPSSTGSPAATSIITNGDIVAGLETVFITAGLVADNTVRHVRVAASNNNFTFQLHGSEIS